MDAKRGETRRSFWLSSVSPLFIYFLCAIFSLIFVPGSIGASYTYTELVPDGLDFVQVYAINDSGVVIGVDFQGGSWKGFIYKEEVYTELLPKGWGSTCPSWINNSGVVVGGGSDGSGAQKGRGLADAEARQGFTSAF